MPELQVLDVIPLVFPNDVVGDWLHVGHGAAPFILFREASPSRKAGGQLAPVCPSHLVYNFSWLPRVTTGLTCGYIGVTLDYYGVTLLTKQCL